MIDMMEVEQKVKFVSLSLIVVIKSNPVLSVSCRWAAGPAVCPGMMSHRYGIRGA